MEETKKILNTNSLPITRRGFMQAFSAVAATATLAGCSDSDDETYNPPVLGNPDTTPDLRKVRSVHSTCPVECLTHSLSCQLVGDHVVRVEPTQMKNDLYYTTACGRGMSRMQFLTENRAVTPMKRIKKGTAKSGAGVVLKDNSVDEWVSISWDQALNEIGAKLKELREAGDNGVILSTGSGNMGPIVNGVLGDFFGYAAPSRVATMGSFCCQSTTDGMGNVYGERWIDTRDTIRDSKCLVFWGNNPADTSNTYWKFAVDAKQAGATLITVDPRFSKSAEKSDQWISPYPGTDTLLAIGVLRYIFENDITGTGANNWIDEEFLKHRTNAAYLIDLSTATEDGSSTVIDLTERFDPITSEPKYPYNKLHNLKYLKSAGGKCMVYDNITGAAVEAELNKGRDYPGRTGYSAPVTQPDLYFHGTVDGKPVITAYQLMRALYAGDVLATAAKPLPAGFTNLYDPNYEYNNIVNVTGIGNVSVLADFASAYANSGKSGNPADKRSMIVLNMGGGQRVENAAHLTALLCILSLVTGNVGEAGNGVDDTSGYNNANGRTSEPPAPRVNLNMTYPKNTGITTHGIPFGVLGSRVSLANDGNPMNSYMNPAVKDPQIKFWWIATHSLTTQIPNSNAVKYALRSTEMVVAAKPTWNTDAEFADYVLPITTPFEYEDIGAGNRNKYISVMEAGVKPYGQARSDLQVIKDLAKIALPAEQAAYFDRTDHDYVEDLITNPANNFASNGVPDYETLKNAVSIRPVSLPGPFIPFQYHEFMGANAIDRKAQIFVSQWQDAAKYPQPRLSPNPAKDLYRGPFPRYVPALESHMPKLDGFSDFPANYKALRSQYKLSCIQFKTPRSVHASFTALPWIREAFGDKGIVQMHPNDALKYGVSNGETVTVKSNVGAIQRIVKVTEFIKEGIVAVENSWWDKYGPLSSSTICAELPDPMGSGHTHNNTLVTILKGGLK